ncbi:MAG: GntR family transcriptional regulator [bacterium]|nr:GntR family transcriptional regulator [bacterium]
MLNATGIRTIPQQIAEQIAKDILSGVLEQETPLREQELSERFGVSRGPIRAALQQLSKEGLVIAVPNVGVRVAPHPSDEVRPVIVQMRKLVEEFTLNMAFDEITDEIIRHLEDALEKLQQACEQGDIHELQEQDRIFHGTLVKLYGEERLFTIWHSMFTWMIFQYGRHKDLMESYREHQAILTAIKNGQKDHAIELLKGNIQ